MGGAGRGEGGRANVAPAPFGVKQELSPSENQEDGRLLASYYIKSEAVVGESTAGLQEVAESALQNQTDEVDQQRIGRQAQGAVKKYFQTMRQAAPAEEPSEE